MIKSNGWISSAIDISRGVRQGCPIVVVNVVYYCGRIIGRQNSRK